MADIDKIKDDPALLAELMINPKSAALKLGVDPDDPSQKDTVDQLEIMSRAIGQNARAAGNIVGIETPELAWGIGASCCNNPLISNNPRISNR